MTCEADNPMTGSDFDWMVSNHAVWGWKAEVKVCVRRFSPSALSLFRSHLSPFPPETPDTQAKVQLSAQFSFYGLRNSKLLVTKSSFEKFNDVFFTAQRKMSCFEILQRQRRFFHSMVKKITFYKLYM